MPACEGVEELALRRLHRRLMCVTTAHRAAIRARGSAVSTNVWFARKRTWLVDL